MCYIIIVPKFQSGGFVAVAFLFEDFSSIFMYGEVFFYILMLLCPCFMEDRLWIKFESILVTLTDGVKKSTFARTCVHICTRSTYTSPDASTVALSLCARSR